MTPQELLTISREAIACMKAHDFAEAARRWETILTSQPNWEHGIGAYNLATCYEEIKRFEEAERLYREAIRQEQDNEMFLGGYGSFLYLHGAAKDAFDIFIQLFRKASARKDSEKLKALTTALIELGERLGLSESGVREHLL